MLPYVKQIARGNPLYDAGSSNLLLCNNLEGWGGVGWEVGGRFKKDGTYVHIHTADSC